MINVLVTVARNQNCFTLGPATPSQSKCCSADPQENEAHIRVR